MKRHIAKWVVCLMCFALTLGACGKENTSDNNANNTNISILNSANTADISYDAEGTTQSGLKWTILDGVLTISGEGGMDNFISDNYEAWRADLYDIKKVVIKQGVTTIGYGAFYECTALESITIPDSVTSIGGFAFKGCQRLEDITIPDNVTTIGESAFNYCPSLETVTIGNGVTKIDRYAFSYCEALVSVSMGKRIKEIDVGAFEYCKFLENLSFNGTKEQWKKVKTGFKWKDDTAITTVSCTDGEVTV